MAITYTLQVTNHPRAAETPALEATERSWTTIYDGPIATATAARATVDRLGHYYRHVRAFRGKTIGRLWYQIDGRSTRSPACSVCREPVISPSGTATRHATCDGR